MEDGTPPVRLATAEAALSWRRHLPNALTLSRVPFLFLVTALLFVPLRGSATLAFVLFVAAAVSDWLDGHLARRLGQVSDFGKLMDALTDKVLTTGMFVTLLVVDLLPEWTLFAVLVILAREFVVTGLRLVAASRGMVLAAEASGKQKTVAQLVAIHVLLAEAVVRHDLAPWLGTWAEPFATLLEGVGLVSFLIAALLTLTSGLGYLSRYGHLLRGDDRPREGDPS